MKLIAVYVLYAYVCIICSYAYALYAVMHMHYMQLCICMHSMHVMNIPLYAVMHNLAPCNLAPFVTETLFYCVTVLCI